MPFDGWSYQPDYFAPPWAFHVGSNSNNLLEPLCFYVPFMEPKPSTGKTEKGSFKWISEVKIYTPSNPLSNVLSAGNSADRLSIDHGNEHLMEVTFDKHQFGRSKDFRPQIPLVVYW